LSWCSASDDQRLTREVTLEAREESSCEAAAAGPRSEARGLYLRVAAFQQSQSLSCERTRFFVATRFDQPLELQNAVYRNVVLDVFTSPAGSLAKRGPHPGGCDVVIASKANIAGRSSAWLAGLFEVSRPLELVADYGRYSAYMPR
jgi:hypothetical protein